MENLPTFVLRGTKRRSIWRFLLPAGRAGCVSSCSYREPLQQLWAGAPSQLWPHLPPHTCVFCCLKEVLTSLCPAVCPHPGAAAPVARPGLLRVPDLTWASSSGGKGMLATPKMSLGPKGLFMADGPRAPGALHVPRSAAAQQDRDGKHSCGGAALPNLNSWKHPQPFAVSFPPSFN